MKICLLNYECSLQFEEFISHKNFIKNVCKYFNIPKGFKKKKKKKKKNKNKKKNRNINMKNWEWVLEDKISFLLRNNY